MDKLIKTANNELGTITATLTSGEVASLHITPVPAEAPGIIVLEPGTAKEEHLYYDTRDAGAGTVAGLVRDITNLNGGVGQEHTNGAAWETMITAEYWNGFVDFLEVGHNEDGTVKVAGTAKTTLVDADVLGFWDSAATFLFKKLTFANLKVALKSWILGDADFTGSAVQRQAIINGGMQIAEEMGSSGTGIFVKDVALYICDLFSTTLSGTAISAGSAGRNITSALGTTGFSLKINPATITGAGTIVHKYRIEAADAKKYKNKVASFSSLVLHDVGSAINYVITVRKANSADNFSAVTEISNSGNISVPTGTGTLIKFENISMGDCSTGIEIEVKAVCGAITAKTFETTEWQMNVGSVALPFVCGNIMEELLKVKRYFQYIGNPIAYAYQGLGMVGTATDITMFLKHEVQMRIAPTVSSVGTFQMLQGGYVADATYASYIGDGKEGFLGFSTTGATAGATFLMRNKNDVTGRLNFNARFTA